MATYLILARYTPQGTTNLQQLPDQEELARQFGSRGVELKAFYLTMGQYDVAAVIEAPDEAAAVRVAGGIAAQGNVSTETLRAFTTDEFRQLVATSS